MTAQTPAILKTYFQTNDRPTEAQFAQLIDSYVNQAQTSAQAILSTFVISGSANTLSIGTTANAAKFTIKGGTTDDTTVDLINNNNDIWKVWNANGGNGLSFQYNGTPRFIISTSGAISPSGGTVGTTTNDSAAAGIVGEYKESIISVATNFPGASGAYGDMTSLSLTAGDWDVSLAVYLVQNGATITPSVRAGISATSGNSATGLVPGSNAFNTLPPTAASESFVVVPNYRVSLSGTTTYYAKLVGTYSVANPQFLCRFSARRVR